MLSDTQHKIYTLLQRGGKTKTELAHILNLSTKTIENNIAKLKSELIDETILHIPLDSGGIRYWLAGNEIETSLPPKKKKFYFKNAAFPDPYIYCKIPDNVEFYDPYYEKKCIALVPVADLHYGSIFADKKRFGKWIDWIASNDYVYSINIGDTMEQSSKISIAAGWTEQDLTPQEQLTETAKLLYPISDKLLFLTRGNHERRAVGPAGIDVMQIIANALNCVYKRVACLLDIEWRGNVWSAYCLHGGFSGYTEGGKLNRALLPRRFTRDIDFYISAHVHDLTVKELRSFGPDRKNMKTKWNDEWCIISGSAYTYFGTYAQEKGLPPGVPGFVRINLYEDGDVHISL